MVNLNRLPNQQLATASTLQNPALRLGLRPALRMQKVIEAIARKHNIDLYCGHPYIKLKMNGYLPLVIEWVGIDRISIAHFYIQNGDVMYDPEVVFWIDNDRTWYPYEVTQSLPYYGCYVEFDGQDKPSKLLNAHMQADLASFANGLFAGNIDAQDWLNRGEVVEKTQDSWISEK